MEISKEVVDKRMKADDFNLIKVIGRGAFGEVQLVRHKFTNKVGTLKEKKGGLILMSMQGCEAARRHY